MKRKYVVIVIVALLLAGSIAGYFLWKKVQGSPYAYDDMAKNGIIDARSKDEIQEILNQQVDKGTFHVSMNAAPEFENGKATGNLWIENIPKNTGDLQVTIQLKKDNKKVFETKKIRPNQNIKEAKLDVDLKKGTYPAIARFVATDTTSGKVIGNANMELTITIKN